MRLLSIVVTVFILLCLCKLHVAAALDLPRYKILVHVVVGESRGEGVRVGTRCLWDTTTDSMVHESFTNVGEACSDAVSNRFNTCAYCSVACAC